MPYRKFLIAIAAFSLIAIGGKADASYSYVVSIDGIASPGTETFTSGSSTLTFSPHSDVGLVGSSQINATSVGLISTAPDATPDSFNFNFLLSVAITNNGVTQTLSFTENIAGTSSLNASNFDTTLISYNPPGSGVNGGKINIGGTLFNLSIGAPGSQDVFFSAPTTNGAAGSISPRIVLSAIATVPEPASMAMVAIGLGGIFVVSRIRRRAA